MPPVRRAGPRTVAKKQEGKRVAVNSRESAGGVQRRRACRTVDALPHRQREEPVRIGHDARAASIVAPKAVEREIQNHDAFNVSAANRFGISDRPGWSATACRATERAPEADA